jgi:exosome complex RNA-binding protein Rrp42 (RNase PH superfamily)
VIDSKTIDLRSLCIAPGTHCWVLYIDALVSSGGSVCSIVDSILCP